MYSCHDSVGSYESSQVDSVALNTRESSASERVIEDTANRPSASGALSLQHSTKRVTFDELIMLVVEGRPPVAIPKLNLGGIHTNHGNFNSSSNNLRYSRGLHRRSVQSPVPLAPRAWQGQMYNRGEQGQGQTPNQGQGQGQNQGQQTSIPLPLPLTLPQSRREQNQNFNKFQRFGQDLWLCLCTIWLTVLTVLRFKLSDSDRNQSVSNNSSLDSQKVAGILVKTLVVILTILLAIFVNHTLKTF
eukprot:TRINITY_DN595_c1_g1_i1.p1 TRINITY_DN595_c1_g1~~TRINITY_DN595_c1_g1_i1.p1  ORF type:complete len:285 (+),score=11.35 TRINITY_DN595_c1_g1_i1:121-855(+)